MQVRIGEKLVGVGNPCYIIAEIGINHNGDINIAKQLIDAAIYAGADAVKFQKRTIEVVYSKAELEKPRESPFGSTNGDLKRGLEFGEQEYRDIDAYCKEKGTDWFASCWDEGSVDFIDQFKPVAYKIASASLTDDNLLKHTRSKGAPVILSTGMSDLPQIEHGIEALGKDDLIVLHCTSTYPSKVEELNLKGMKTIADKFKVPVGYSGHEVGLSTTVAAAVLGACIVERHITLDRAMWGSDQAASVEPHGFKRLIRDIRTIEKALGDGAVKVYDSEKPIIEKLRRKGK
jgi:N-acetylneuraminate synthase